MGTGLNSERGLLQEKRPEGMASREEGWEGSEERRGEGRDWPGGSPRLHCHLQSPLLCHQRHEIPISPSRERAKGCSQPAGSLEVPRSRQQDQPALSVQHRHPRAHPAAASQPRGPFPDKNTRCDFPNSSLKVYSQAFPFSHVEEARFAPV